MLKSLDFILMLFLYRLLCMMTKISFRDRHLLTFLEDYSAQDLPLDLLLRRYFKEHKALGPKDRAYIAETIYSMVRWQGLIDHQLDQPTFDLSIWERRLEVFKKLVPEEWSKHQEIPLHIRLSFPKVLFELLVASHGIEYASQLCAISNQAAPTTVRVNTLKLSRDDVLAKWNQEYDVAACQLAPNGITFHKKINFFGLEEFKKGWFEVQDENSQLIADLVQPEPGQWVLDYCAGSGGKTLAFAPLMQKTGQIFLHDSRPFALQEARKRLRRAGIQNSQVVLPDDEAKLKKLKKKMHRVLVDVPCSGTGTMRRNPDMKWKFTTETLERLCGLQRTIFEKALSFLRPDGYLIYATCSLLKEENQEQVAHFLRSYPLQIVGESFQTFPQAKKGDGFFGIVFKFNN